MKVVIGSLKRFWKRYKEENPTIQLSVPIVGGFAANIPLAEKGKLKRTRTGVNAQDRANPFVESDTNNLVKYYSHYELEKEYKFCRSPYAETIPLRRGSKGFSYGKNVDDLEVSFIDAKYMVPDYLKEHSEKAVELFKALGKIKIDDRTGEFQNDYSIRITSFDIAENKVHIQPATYFDQVATNLTLDWASGVLGEDPLLTIRNDYEKAHNGLLTPLRSSILANTLGVAAVVVNPDTNEVLVPIRGNEQAIMDNGLGKFHCSVSGVFAWNEHETIANTLSFDFFYKGIEKEIKSEIGLRPNQYNLIPLAFTRELVRGGKPQLFFIAETTLDIASIHSEMEAAEESWEFISIESIDESNPLYKYIESPLSAPQEMFTYEGWMALKIAMAYLYKTEPPFRAC
ncbi:hypothetical protein TW81_18665 [Vibrio galatheae]|uniref:Nudix hydrolase domain-containing protein n=1 Tax=Vibrio galatheae TaxID=579748 RepID=A0A0F4NCZ6_9VIBR|nr:hypothetical protein [Vibrio galatheae]KJY80758.1 hypothetical protein TW81_18665 [Vibrio galatheae]